MQEWTCYLSPKNGSYVLVFRTGMAQYSGTRHAEIRRLQGRRARFPPLGVHLNAYYGVHDQVIVVTPEAGAIFVHGRTGTLYYYHEEVEGFINADGDAYVVFWEVQTPSVVPPSTTLPLPSDLTAYPPGALNRGWFLTADPHRECQQVKLRARMSSSSRRITTR